MTHNAAPTPNTDCNNNHSQQTNEVTTMNEPSGQSHCQQRLHQFLDISRYYLLTMPLGLAQDKMDAGDRVCASPACQ